MILVGLDPGYTTGCCVYDTSLPPHVSANVPAIQVGQLEGYARLWRFIEETRPDRIIYERFDYRRRIDNADLTAVEMIGVIRLYSELTDTPLIPQQQLKGHKGLWTDSKLKTLGLYQKSMPHAMDALRQVLFYVTIKQNSNYWIEKYNELSNEGTRK